MLISFCSMLHFIHSKSMSLQKSHFHQNSHYLFISFSTFQETFSLQPSLTLVTHHSQVNSEIYYSYIYFSDYQVIFLITYLVVIETLSLCHENVKYHNMMISCIMIFSTHYIKFISSLIFISTFRIGIIISSPIQNYLPGIISSIFLHLTFANIISTLIFHHSIHCLVTNTYFPFLLLQNSCETKICIPDSKANLLQKQT